MLTTRALLNRDGPLQFIRTIKTPRKHLEPKELAWQWEVKKDPALDYCGKSCLTCPKKSFFPRFRKAYISADVHSCKKKKKPMTWFEYFSFLLPNAAVASKPPLRTCRKLLALRQDLCLDPQDWACCEVKCMKQPKEWYGQGVVHVIVSNLPEVQPPLLVKPCSPPDHMIPRCVIAKKGMPTSTSKSCQIDYIYKKPYGDFFGFSTKPPTSRSDRFVCRVKCFDEFPKVHDKNIKLSCRSFAEFKDVECPKELYTRYKNVSVTPCGDLKPVLSKDTSAKIEIKKGVCGRQTLLRPSGIRNFSTRAPGKHSTDEILKAMSNSKPYLQPSKPSVNPDNIMKRGGIRPQLKENTMPEIRPHRMPPSFRKGGGRKMPKKPEILNQRFDMKQISGLPRVDTKSFSTSSAVFKDKKKKKKEDKEKYVPICSGCPGVREALSDVKKKKEVFKCRKRASGKCPGPTRPHGPLDPPILSPYWKCKTAALSRCNQPRPVVVKKERGYKMPCEQEKKFHTFAAQLMFCNDGCSPPPNKAKRLTPLEIPRESCFDKKCPKKEKEPQGILCKVASFFGIGCGKKKDCMKFDKKQVSGLPRVDTKSFSTSSAVFKDKKKKKKEDKEKYVPICSGCPGVREALSDVKKKKEIIKCRKRASGKCPGPTRPHGPLDPPILSPYWKCKTAAVSKCNRPRPAVVKKERGHKMPCEQEKKFHTSASQLLAGLKGCSPISNNVKRMAPVESWRQLPREHPFDKKAAKKGEGSILCFIARMFRIGCGKKKENESLNRQSGAEITSKAYSTTSYNPTTNYKSHYQYKKLSLPFGSAIVNSNKQISRSVHSTNSTLKKWQSSVGKKFNDAPDKKFVRNECFPRVDTSKRNKGILCKIFAFFGIGCAKKSDVGCKKCQFK